jgi:hypothetical protein
MDAHELASVQSELRRTANDRTIVMQSHIETYMLGTCEHAGIDADGQCTVPTGFTLHTLRHDLGTGGARQRPALSRPQLWQTTHT